MIKLCLEILILADKKKGNEVKLDSISVNIPQLSLTTATGCNLENGPQTCLQSTPGPAKFYLVGIIQGGPKVGGQ